ncbi:MAG: hypothetical protein ACYSR0_13105 [Planctomycetota bacterium]|jgi:hypothetical protein
MRLLPSIAFWVLIFTGRRELGFKGTCFCIVLWIVLLLGFVKLGLPRYWFAAAQALIDAILIIVIFGGDIRIR